MATTNELDALGTINEKDGLSDEYVKGTFPNSISKAKPKENEIKAWVDAMWEQMNKAIPTKTLKISSKDRSSIVNKKIKESIQGWMAYLGLAPKNTKSLGQDVWHKKPSLVQDSRSDEIKRLVVVVATTLSTVADAAAIAAIAGRGKVEITEVRDFVGQEIEVKKLVDTNSKEASKKVRGPAPSDVDVVLEQLKKKHKLSVLDKTKKDWG